MPHKVVLNWNAPTAGDAPAQYDIQRSTVQAGPFTLLATVPATQTTYEDDAVAAGDNFFYEVLSKNAAGESGPSNEITITVPLAIPEAPLNLTAQAF